ncbi:MAG: 50S ribosomal protein L11 methyltransferase [Desulfuromonadaceae bacterium]|nr:50S ribosomal protein L11 methyltransferase [Desulfuromonadaceae bacterium]
MARQFSPFPIGNSFEILPADTPPTTSDRIPLIMAAGAFGSGEHETTASCLEVMEQIPDLAGKRVLDLGSGTGILSIAAIKLGAASALCVDIDPAAVKTCQHNSALNQVAAQIEHVCGTLDQVGETDFDLILANIYGDILLAVAEDLVRRARPGVPMLLSGILFEYNFDVRNRYRQLGCQVEKNRLMEEFSTVLLKAPPATG